MLNKDNDIVLADFGISKRFQNNNDVFIGTKGTIKYLAPEMVKIGTKEKPKILHGRKTDIWAAGITLY